VVAMGTTLAIATLRTGVSPVAGIPPQVFVVLPLGEMVAFAFLFAAAIALRKRTDHHKRLMLLASISILAPAFARFPTDAIGLSGPPVFFALTDLFILACIAYDWFKNRRLHPAFVGGLAFIVVVQIGRLVLSQTAAWDRFATWLIG
jgi:F0F1-type ATP synthase assembly protein I